MSDRCPTYVPLYLIFQVLSDDQNRINDEFIQMQRTIMDHGNTTNVWKQNADYNRYNDMVCFDQTRVILNDGLQPDYIHANYVNGYHRKHAYILTQVSKNLYPEKHFIS